MFIHLRAHSAYSLLEGAVPVKKLIKAVAKDEMPAVAMTDSGNLFGALEFALEARSAGVQPIIGCQVQITPPSDVKCGLGETDTLVFLVQSELGYGNLMKIVTYTFLEGQSSGAPQISLSTLKARGWTEGLICLTGGPLQGRLSKSPLHAEDYLKQLLALFPDRLYIELIRQGEDPQQTAREDHLIDLAYAHNVPLVATNQAFFLDPQMYEAHDALICIAEGTYVNVPDRKRVTPDHCLKSPEEMEALFADLPEAIANTVHIAKRCHFLLKTTDPILPSFPTEEGQTQADLLRNLSNEGLEKRLVEHVIREDMTAEEKAQIRKKYFDQLDYELGVIEQMGFPGYFLVVADFIQWAKEHAIPVGPGRGSGAGSIVAWALTITGLDPIHFGLVFERFLNPERVSMPDFDIDFCQDRRDEVIRYVRDKYGADRVAHIITFGKLQARAVLRDVGRVLQMPYGQVDRICKLVPNNPTQPVTLEEAIEMEPQLQDMRRSEPEVEHLMTIALQLEGLYRHASTHAAGVVIGDRPLNELVALYHDDKSQLPATQFNMKYVESAGLVKFDFLGLKTLTVIQKTIEYLAERNIDLNIETIPLDDKKTFELLCRVETTGVFQVESSGMGEVIRKLQPERLEEIIAVVALYRPGPMDYIPQYISRRHGEEKVTYMYPQLETILGETFGVIVYQEQVLQIARDLAGYTLGGADLLRRAMGKKIKSEMDQQRKIFVDGVLEKIGGTMAKATSLFNQIEKFASYAFNKAHAAAYGLIAYQTAYLKAHYPAQFMAASMTLDMHNTDKLAFFNRELQHMGITVLPPDINTSNAAFKVEEQACGTLAIRYALAALKNVGEGAMESLVEERTKRGPFKNIFDVFERLDAKVLNKRMMENLVGAGGFDSLIPNRNQMFVNLETLVRYGTAGFQGASLFGVDETRPQLKEVPEFSPLEKLKYELASVGFYLTGHPLDAYGEALAAVGITPSSKMLEALEATGGEATFKLAGIVLSKQERTARSGNRFAFIQFSDSSGIFEVTLFSEILTQYRSILEPGKAFLVTVIAKMQDDALRLTAQSIEDLDAYTQAKGGHMVVRVNTPKTIATLAQLLGRCGEGKTSLDVEVELDDKIVTLKLPRGYLMDAEILSQIQGLAA